MVLSYYSSLLWMISEGKLEFGECKSLSACTSMFAIELRHTVLIYSTLFGVNTYDSHNKLIFHDANIFTIIFSVLQLK